MSDAANIGNWVMSGANVLGFILVLAKLSGRAERREIQQPLVVDPLPKFAPLNHSHPEYITRGDCREMHLDNRRAETEKFEAIQRQLDHFGTKLEGTLADHNKAAESRANALHGRISDLVPVIAQVEGRLNDHIADHRRKP